MKKKDIYRLWRKEDGAIGTAHWMTPCNSWLVELDIGGVFGCSVKDLKKFFTLTPPAMCYSSNNVVHG